DPVADDPPVGGARAEVDPELGGRTVGDRRVPDTVVHKVVVAAVGQDDALVLRVNDEVVRHHDLGGSAHPHTCAYPGDDVADDLHTLRIVDVHPVTGRVRHHVGRHHDPANLFPRCGDVRQQ